MGRDFGFVCLLFFLLIVFPVAQTGLRFIQQRLTLNFRPPSFLYLQNPWDERPEPPHCVCAGLGKKPKTFCILDKRRANRAAPQPLSQGLR